MVLEEGVDGGCVPGDRAEDVSDCKSDQRLCRRDLRQDQSQRCILHGHGLPNSITSRTTPLIAPRRTQDIVHLGKPLAPALWPPKEEPRDSQKEAYRIPACVPHSVGGVLDQEECQMEHFHLVGGAPCVAHGGEEGEYAGGYCGAVGPWGVEGGLYEGA